MELHDRHCPLCDAAGPFYPSRPGRREPCIPCYRALSQARYARDRLYHATMRRSTKLATLRAIPDAQRSPHQQKQLLQATCLPWQKVCVRCLTIQDRETAFGRFRRSKDGRDCFCATCRRTLMRAFRAKHRAQGPPSEEQGDRKKDEG